MKDWKKLLKLGGQANQLTANILEKSARDNFKGFCETFLKDFGSTLDFSKGHKFLDDDIDFFMPATIRKDKNAFNLFVEAHLKTGEISRSLINAVCEMQSGQMKVGIADVPNKVYDAYQEALDKYEDDDEDDEEEEEIDEEAVMLTFLKTFKEKMKSGELKPMSDQSPNCTRCGRSDLPLTITINASTMESQKICSVCMSKGGASGNAKPQKADVDKWDKEIASLEKLAKEYEELIKKHPESDNLPSGIAQYAMTPMSNYKSIQALLADARSERMKAMISMKSEIRLNYELKKAVEAENYEESAKLRDKLNQIKK